MYNGQDMPIIRVIYVLESAEAGERWQPLGYQQVCKSPSSLLLLILLSTKRRLSVIFCFYPY